MTMIINESEKKLHRCALSNSKMGEYMTHEDIVDSRPAEEGGGGGYPGSADRVVRETP